MKPGGLHGGEGTEPFWVPVTNQLPGPQFPHCCWELEGGRTTPTPHQLPWASSAQIPAVGGHRLLDGARALHFPRIQEGDSGLYSCRAENQAGIAQRDFDLLVLSE